MDLLKDNLKKIYLRFLFSSLGSALVSSIYGLVDMAMVGQYQGPSGAAAMAVIAPIWNILYSFGLLCGIGGSVLYAVAHGRSGRREANSYFTASVLLGGGISLVLWGLLWALEVPVLRLFGADDSLLPLCRSYLTAPKLTVPFYVFSGILAAFLRNDSDPGLAGKAVLAGGIFNVFGDYFLVFVMDLGIKGAGIATAMGAGFTDLVMLTHFLKKKNTLSLAPCPGILRKFGGICVNGFSSFIVDIAMGILTMLFNRQVMKYLGGDALAVYGVIVSVSTFVQCCAYGIGQAAQPILSQNYGAGLYGRVQTVLRYSVLTSGLMGLLFTALTMALPEGMVRIFMSPTPEVLAIAPPILRVYAVSFLLLPFNVSSTYYFQATLQPGVSAAASVARGIVLSGGLILLLPLLNGGAMLWWAMPITEAAVALFSGLWIRRQTRRWA